MLLPRRLFLVTCACALTACDLPTDAASARELLGGESTIPFTIPIRAFDVTLGDHLDLPDAAFGTPFDIPAGVSASTRIHLGFDAAAAGIARSVRSAALELRMTNSTPVAADVFAVLAPTPADTTGFDPLTSSARIELPAVSIASRTQSDAQRIVIPADRLEALASGRVSVALELRIRANDAVILMRDDALRIAPVLHVVLGRVAGER